MARHSLANPQIRRDLIGVPFLDPAKQKRSTILHGKLAQSPREKMANLWSQYTLIQIQSLMAPEQQAEREKAAQLLIHVSQEAIRLAQ